MLLSDFSIKRPVSTVVIIIALMCLGLLALNKLRVNQIPDVEQPVMVVLIPYPGASPETVEREIINRVERALQSIPQVYQIRSTSSESTAQVVIIFNFKKNMAEAADEIRNAIASVRHKLPIEMREPILRRIDPSAQPIMQLALSSTVQSFAEISRLAEDVLADRFRGIDGVAVVNVNGSLKRELSVLLGAEKLREYNVSVTDVVNALRAQNTTAPVGRVKGTLDEQSIRLVGRIESPREFNDIVVRRRGDEIVRLGQVATVEDGFAELAGFSLRNAHPNVGISVTRSRDASTVTVANKVRDLIEEINKTLPKGTKIEVTQDGGKDADNSLQNVIEALMFGALLTIFVVYAFLNSWRSTLITALSLPTSVIAAFIAVWACGFTLNFMTLLGLSLAIGVLIDDAIVVRENIVRHMERGAERMAASRLGTAEIGLAVTATTFSIIAVFIPVAFMGGGAGEWFRPFALTVATSVLVSLYISFTLDPMLSAYWGDPVGYQHQEKKGISKVLKKFNVWFDHQADRYGNVISWALHHRKWMTAIAVVSFVGALALQAMFGSSTFLPPSDYGTLAIDVRTPSSASLEYTKLKVEKGAELARTIRETVATNTNVYAGGGRVYVDVGKRNKRDRSVFDIGVDLRKLLGQLVGAEYVVIDDLNQGVRKPVQIQFSGPDYRRLMAITGDFMEKMKTIPGAVDVGLSEQEPKDELKIELNRGLANSLRRRRGRRLGRPDRRIARRLGAAASRRPRRRFQHRAPADRGDRQQHDGAARPDRHGDDGQGPGADPAPRRQAHGRGRGQHAGPGLGRDHSGRAEAREADRLPDRLRHHARRRLARPAGSVPRDVHRAHHGHRAHVPGAGDAVRLLHRAGSGDDLAAAVADRRGDRAPSHGRFAQPHELHRHHHADGPGGEERDPAPRLRAQGGGEGDRPRGGVDARRAREAAPDPDDHLRADRRHDAGGDRHRRGRRVLPPDGGRDHRRHHHLDVAHAAGGADLLRLDRDRARPCLRQVRPPGAALESVLRLRRDPRGSDPRAGAGAFVLSFGGEVIRAPLRRPVG